MKHLSYLILSFFILSLNLVQAQDVNWSENTGKKGGLVGIVYLAGMTDSEYYVIQRPRKSNEIKTYNHSHKLTSTRPVDIKIEKQDPFVCSIIETSTGKYAILKVKNKGNGKKKFALYAATFDGNKLGEPFPIHTHDFKVQFGHLGVLESYSFVGGKDFEGLIKSNDNSKITYMNYIDGMLDIAVFDNKMKRLWTKNVDVPFYYDDFRMEQINLTNEGDIVFGGRSRTWRDDNYLKGCEFKVFKISKEDEREFKFAFDGKEIPKDFGLLHSTSTEVKFGGTFTTLHHKKGYKYFHANNKIKGVYFGTLNYVNGDVDLKAIPFSDSFKDELFAEPSWKFGNDGSHLKPSEPTYAIRDFIEFEDGSMSFLAASQYMTKVVIKNGNDVDTKNYYHSDEIIIPRIGSDGELISMNQIDKKYSSKHRNSCSYNLGRNDNGAFLVYNTRKSKEEKNDLNLKGYRFTDMRVINKSGEVEKAINLISAEDKEIDSIFLPRWSKVMENKLILFGMARAKYQFGTLVMN